MVPVPHKGSLDEKGQSKPRVTIGSGKFGRIPVGERVAILGVSRWAVRKWKRIRLLLVVVQPGVAVKLGRVWKNISDKGI